MSASSSSLVLTSVDAGLLRIRLNRPEALNAWTPELGRELLAALVNGAAEPAVRAILITGEGRAFSAGADLKVPREQLPDGSPDLSTRLREIYNPLVATIAAAPKPVVAGIQGAAAGLGAVLALACDCIIAAESAYLLLPFVKLGLIPDAGGSYLLASRVGYGRALELAMLGERLDAARGLDWGVITRVVADTELDSAAAAFAAQLAGGPTVALANMKRALRAGSQAQLESALALDAELQQRHATTHDYAEGIAAFREKRPPRFTGA